MVEGEGGIRTTWPGAILCKYSQVPTNPASNSFQGPGEEEGKKEGRRTMDLVQQDKLQATKVGGHASSEQALVVRCLLARFRSSLLCLSACMQQAPHAAALRWGGWMPAFCQGVL